MPALTQPLPRDHGHQVCLVSSSLDILCFILSRGYISGLLPTYGRGDLSKQIFKQYGQFPLHPPLLYFVELCGATDFWISLGFCYVKSGCFLAFSLVGSGFSFLGTAKSVTTHPSASSFQNFVAVVCSPILFVLVGLCLKKKKSLHCCFSEVLGGNESECGYLILHLYLECLHNSISSFYFHLISQHKHFLCSHEVSVTVLLTVSHSTECHILLHCCIFFFFFGCLGLFLFVGEETGFLFFFFSLELSSIYLSYFNPIFRECLLTFFSFLFLIHGFITTGLDDSITSGQFNSSFFFLNSSSNYWVTRTTLEHSPSYNGTFFRTLQRDANIQNSSVTGIWGS